MDLQRLGIYCQHRFSFGGWQQTLKKLEEGIFTAVVTEALQQIAHDKEFPCFLTGYIEIIRTRTRNSVLQFCVRVDCRVIIDTFHQGFDTGFAISINDELELFREVWIHGYLLVFSHPRLVSQYYKSINRTNLFHAAGVPVGEESPLEGSESDSEDSLSVISISSAEPEEVIDLTND